jgi:hypothetical protein
MFNLFMRCTMLSQIARGVLVLLGGVIVAHSQVEVTLQLPFAQQMPPQVAEWRENESLIRVVVQNTGRERYTGLMISAELQRDGRRIATTRNGHPAQPRFDLSPGEVRTLSWREVIAEPAIEYDRSIAEMVMTSGELPAGNYQLCLQVLDARLRPIGRPGCGTFTIILADPPVLLSPIRGVQAPVMPLLQWTPSTPPAPGLQYRVTLKVRYQGQTPAQAMASNPIRLQVDVPATSYQVPVTEQLGPDATDPNYAGHVWQVQALLNGRPYGRNRGLSQIEWFTVPPMAVDPVKPGSQVQAVVWDIGREVQAVVWDIPYEDLLHHGATISATLPKDAPDTLLYVLRLHIPMKLSVNTGRAVLDRWLYADDARLGRPSGGDTAGQVDRTRYTGGFFLYRISGDTTQPPQLMARQMAYNAGKEGAIIVERNGLLVIGTFTPTHLALPLHDIIIEPTEGGEPPICNLPPSGEGHGYEQIARENAPPTEGPRSRRWSGYVFNPAIASGAGRASGKTLGAITQRQAPPQGSGQNHYAGVVIPLPKPSEVGLPDFRMAPPSSSDTSQVGGGVVVCWPNGKDPDGKKPHVQAVVDMDEGVIICVWPGRPPKGPIKAVVKVD